MTTKGERLTSAAIAPDSTEQVQAVMRIANQYRIPIYPISTGKNLGYGGSAPAYSGSVVLDLKRMNRILNVDERNHTVLVEPGVTFWEIAQYFEDNNLDLTLDIPDPAWGSLVGHALDRGVGHTYSDYGRDRFGSACGMEVVLANGDIIRTATGALETSTMWQDHEYGIGPSVDGIFSQSNYGVVTKMGVWLMDEPPAYRAGRITVPRHEDIVELIDTLKPLWRQRVLTNYPNMRRVDFSGPSGWYNRLAFYGDRRVVDRHWELVQDAYAGIPGAELETTLYEAPYNPDEWDLNTKLLAGVPYMEAMYGIGHNVYFLLVVPFRGASIWQVIQTFDEIAQKYGRRFFGTPVHVHSPRGLLTTVSIRVDKDDPETNRTDARDGARDGHRRGSAWMGRIPRRTGIHRCRHSGLQL
ncbi:FAD-binding oxidoreductase [Candidatus Rariloculus sp.]|uniref:FAD-binding oxidoreductase n=1 Tax=Candidatus Rariloculus sp. TaxID=3101265 RepID=UPI003D0D800D